MAKRTYFTKQDMIEFGKFIVSDTRRGIKQREARKSFDEGIINSLGWAAAERFVCEKDLELWKQTKGQ